ncbi:histidine kinase, partial [Flavobacterium sp. WLB]
MKSKIFYIVILLFVTNLNFLFSQEKKFFEFEKKEIQQGAITYKGKINFVKAQSFYLKEDWDSTLVYSMKQLNNNNHKVMSDYCHYFRGVSFFHKKLYKEAQKEFFLVSEKFVLTPIKNFTLGASFLESKQFQRALFYFRLSEKQFIKLNEDNYLADIYTGIGSSYIY